MVTLDTLRLEKRAEIFRFAEARGAHREESDVDLPVEFDRGKTLLDLIGLNLDLENLLGVQVDVVTPNSLRYIRDRAMAEVLPL
jgi:predicted nucleotidyltransferase